MNKKRWNRRQTRLDTRQSSCGRLGRSSNAKTAQNLTRPDTRPIPVADGWAEAEMHVFPLFNSSVTGGRTNKAFYRVACLKKKKKRREKSLLLQEEEKTSRGGEEGFSPMEEEKEIEQVIQGSHMVSGTRCPAWTDLPWLRSGSRAAAPKGRCPIEHRGDPLCLSV